MQVKTELASVERRRKKLRRKERESKQDTFDLFFPTISSKELVITEGSASFCQTYCSISILCVFPHYFVAMLYDFMHC